MKRGFVFVFLGIGAILSAQNKPVLQEASSDEVAKYTSLGSIVAGKLLKSLKSELMIAMKEGGVASAISRCNINAIPLTKELISTDNTIRKVKRTTKKYRNIDNRPDALEDVALDYLRTNEVPEYVQKYQVHDSTFYNYFQPIKVGSFCIKCHGVEDKMDKEALTLIKKLYPDDLGRGYKTGDFRGAIKITFSE